MKFTISQQELNKNLTFVSKAVTARSTMPILKGILLSVQENGTLTMTASDMDLSIEKRVPVSVEQPGSIVMPARLFTEAVKRFPDEDINITLEENNTVTLNTLRNNFKIVGMAADEFPKLDEINETRRISLNRNLFGEMIRKTSFAASTDESKGVIVGVLIEIRNNVMNMAALDGFRMAVTSKETENDQDTDIIISARILNEINKILPDDEENDTIDLILDEKKAVVMTEDSRIILRMIEGNFLKYRDLLPTEFKTTVTINREQLVESIERASLLAIEGRNNLVRFSFKDDILHITSKSEAGDVDENIQVSKTGDDIEIGFNSKYLMDGLKAIEDEEIIFSLNTNIAPCIIRPAENDNYTYLILPVRIIS